MRLVAARIGHQLNFRDLSEELGIPETTLNTYLTVLEKQPLSTCFQNIQRMVEIVNFKVTKSISQIRGFAPS